MPRSKTSPWKYDRAAVRYVLEHEGVDAARARWPREVVNPIARALHLIEPYRPSCIGLSAEQIAALGSKPDALLAGEWGIPLSTVVRARGLLAIAPAGLGDRRRRLAERLSALTDADLCGPIAALSSRTELPAYVLMAERGRRGIRGSARGGSYRAPVHERRLVAFRALRETYPAITLEELGEVFRLTRERVRQIEQEASIRTTDRRSA